MRILIIIVFFYIFKLQAATWIEENVGNIVSYEKINLPDGSVYSISIGIKHLKKNVYTTTKFEIPDNIFTELKNDD